MFFEKRTAIVLYGLLLSATYVSANLQAELDDIKSERQNLGAQFPSKEVTLREMQAYATKLKETKNNLITEHHEVWDQSKRDTKWYDNELSLDGRVEAATRFLKLIYSLLVELDIDGNVPGVTWRKFQKLRLSFEPRITEKASKKEKKKKDDDD